MSRSFGAKKDVLPDMHSRRPSTFIDKDKYKTLSMNMPVQEKPAVYSMPRICHLFAFKLEMMPSFQQYFPATSELRIDVTLKKKSASKSIKSSYLVDDIKQPLKLSTLFQIQYTHHFKKRSDILVISLKHSSNKKFSTLGSVEVRLDEVLQSGLDSTLVLLTKKKVEVAKIALKCTTLPTTVEQNPDAIEEMEHVEDEVAYNSESGSSSEDESDDEVEVHGYHNTNEHSPEEKNKLNVPDLIKKGLNFLKSPKIPVQSPNNEDPSTSVAITSPRGLDLEHRTSLKDMRRDDPKKELVTIETKNDVFTPEQYLREDQTEIFFINIKTRRGKRLFDYCLSKNLVMNAIVPTKCSEDVMASIKYIVNYKSEQFQDSRKHLNIRIVGTDSFVNDILRACVSLASETKIWELFNFSIIPIGKEGTCEIGEYLASVNELYKNQYFSLKWKEIFARDEKINDEQGHLIEDSIKTLMRNTTQTIKLDICELLITILKDKGHEEQISLPFLDSVIIGDDKDEKPSEITIDFWKKDKDKEAKKVTKSKTFQTITVYRIPRKTIPSEFQPKNGLTLMTTQKNTSVIKKSEIKTEYDQVSKFICKADKKKTGIRIIVDGVSFYGVKFISITPKWTGSLQFPILMYPEEVILERPSIDLNY